MSKEKNLSSLVAEFRDNGKAADGYNHISTLLNKGNEKELTYLLRNHATGDVYGEELLKRFEVDTLLEFYNLLLIAALAGYVDPKFNNIIREEIKFVLSQRALKQYYINYYPYKLVEYCFAYVRFEKFFEVRTSDVTLSAFTYFISLNRLLKKDKDVERFLNMLDHVSYGEDDINDVIEILSSSEKLHGAITAKNKSADETAVLGFFKYTAFISQLRQILESLEEFQLLQSSMWLYHGYYLDRMNLRMKEFFQVAFENIAKALSSKDAFENMTSDVFEQSPFDSFDEMELRKYAYEIVSAAKSDVEKVLDKRWARPIEIYFSGLL